MARSGHSRITGPALGVAVLSVDRDILLTRLVDVSAARACEDSSLPWPQGVSHCLPVLPAFCQQTLVLGFKFAAEWSYLLMAGFKEGETTARGIRWVLSHHALDDLIDSLSGHGLISQILNTTSPIGIFWPTETTMGGTRRSSMVISMVLQRPRPMGFRTRIMILKTSPGLAQQWT